MDIDKNSWIKSYESYQIDEKNGLKYLTASLYDLKGNCVKNKIRLHPMLENYCLENINGIFKYNLTGEEDDYIMNKLFTTYNEEKINKLQIKKCVMLSVDIDKYNKLRNETINILNQYNIPNLSVHYGYTQHNVSKSKFYNYMQNKNIRNELVCGMLEIFDNFINESDGNEWLLFFEDDVRPVNIDISENLNFLYNVPKDAELIRPYMGKNTDSELKDIQYKYSYGGDLYHAFYISTSGCKKVINYVKKYGWKFNSDIDIYKLSKFNQDIPTGYDGWSFISTNGLSDAVKVDSEDEKIAIYHMSNIIFNQTSLPCAPFTYMMDINTNTMIKINKTIYMTYKKNIPDKVKNRWIENNNDYKIDFSLDKDCLEFLETNFNKNVSNLFSNINRGMYKADLWRLCKLYINSGVYADVDLIPYFNINKLDTNITFYTCLSSIDIGSIFQAFMVIFSKPKNPLLLVFLLSFIINSPYNYYNGPCYDMYNCIKYMLNVETILPEKKYEINSVKLKICIGSSKSNIKVINLYYFPDDIQYSIILHKNFYADIFNFEINNNYLIVKRLDNNCGWDHNHFIDICFPAKTSFLFFKENIGSNNNWVTSYVVHNNKKILESRDMDYYKNGGW